MEATEVLSLVVEILNSFVLLIPLIVGLVSYVKKSIKEKNWSALVSVVLDYIKQAEALYSDGADKKEWVMTMVKESASLINYELEEEKLSSLIDNIVAITKEVNVD